MCKRAQMISPITAVAPPYPAVRSLGEFAQLGRGDDPPRILDGRSGALRVDARLIARRLHLIDALLVSCLLGRICG